ncbi:MAG: hypothetical protein GF364_01925 [Candidatus Lokiarchaeota archaeon]|nr:hypothetical protein [Candidatus Lokiarchaeota archaeon]
MELNLSKDHIILPKTHRSMYLMHKFWARKPYNVVSEYIRKYTSENDVVLDPFCGSGVTIAESLLLKRKVVGIDFNPFAIFLTKNTIAQVNLNLLNLLFSALSDRVVSKIAPFYKTNCPYCDNPAIITQSIWKNTQKDSEEPPNEVLDEIRIKCPNCKLRNAQIDKKEFSDFYKSEIKRVENINDNYQEFQQTLGIDIPTFQFKYKNGKYYRQLRHHLRNAPKLEQLFTKRNLLVLGLIKKEIQDLNYREYKEFTFESGLKRDIKEIDFEKAKDLLMITFTANLGQSSKMVWVISKRKKKKLKKREVGSWTHHFLWNPDVFFEVNPWRGYKTRFRKTKRSKNDYKIRLKQKRIEKVEVAESIKGFNQNNRRNVLLLNQSSEQITLDDETVDYIFTDPPYGDSVQYLELTSLWNSWLGNRVGYKNEIIINKNQNKEEKEYSSKLYAVFKECYRVLKSGHYMTVTFHNTDLNIRNILISSVTRAGFKIENLIFQMPPRNSLKSYLHYNKSPVGDYFIKFKKDPKFLQGRENLKSKKVKPLILKRKLNEYIEHVLLSRAESTPAILLFNFIDEFLVEENYFPLKNAKIIDKIMEDLVNSERYMVTKKNEWWFAKKYKPDLTNKPLSARIKSYLERLENSEEYKSLYNQKSKRKTYSNIYNLIYREFNGILTPDRRATTKIIDNVFFKKC